MSEINATSTPAGLDSAEPVQPAPAADDQKAALPAAAEATAETPKEETPEQIEERRREKARQHEQRRLQRRTTEAAEAKAEAKLLREENERLRQAKQQREQGSDEPKRNGINPKTGSEYTYEEYIEARADWRADRRVDERLTTERKAQSGREQQSRQASEQAEMARNWNQREAEFQKATKDYAAVVGPFMDGDLQDLHQDAKTAIAGFEKGPELLYFLAQPDNADEVARIAGLSPQRQVMELGVLTSKLGAQTAKPSNAPDPIKPLGQGRSGTKDPSKMTDTEYKAFRKSQGARWAQ